MAWPWLSRAACDEPTLALSYPTSPSRSGETWKKPISSVVFDYGNSIILLVRRGVSVMDSKKPHLNSACSITISEFQLPCWRRLVLIMSTILANKKIEIQTSKESPSYASFKNETFWGYDKRCSEPSSDEVFLIRTAGLMSHLPLLPPSEGSSGACGLRARQGPRMTWEGGQALLARAHVTLAALRWQIMAGGGTLLRERNPIWKFNTHWIRL